MHFPAIWATVRFSILLWLPLLLLEVTRPFEISTLMMSPATRAAFFYAALVAVLVAAGLGGVAAAMAAGREQATRALCGQGGSASGAIAFLALQPAVQRWGLERDLAPHLGSALAFGIAALVAGLVAWLLSSAPPKRVRKPFALAATCLLLALWWARTIVVFAPEPSVSHWSAMLCGAAAAGWLLRNTFVDATKGLQRGLAADFFVAVAIPCILMVVTDPQGRRAGEEPADRVDISGINVLLIIVDTLRADHTDLATTRHGTTPRLAKAAAIRGTRFTQAWSAAPNTIPSIKALFTGQLASQFGGEARIVKPPPIEAYTLAEALRDAGFETAGFTANGLVGGEGFEQGFASYWNLASHDQFTHSFFLNRLLAGRRIYRGFAWMEALHIHKEQSQTMTALARKWISRSGPRPFFLYLHLLDPHWPYQDRGMGAVPQDMRDLDTPLSHIDFLRLPPPNPRHGKYARDSRMREMKGRYDDEILASDRDLGDLLDVLEAQGLDDSTLVVIAGDHGEEFFEHFAFGHGQDVYVEEVHVPLVFLWPEDPRFDDMPKQLDLPVSLVDVLPTLLDLLDLPPLASATLGRSLVPALRGESEATHPPVLAESRDARGLRFAYREGTRVARFAYVNEGQALETIDQRVFDMRSDPEQQAPRSANAAETSLFVEHAKSDLRARGIR